MSTLAEIEQAAAARDAAEDDLAADKLVRVDADWAGVWRTAQEYAARHAASTGCRSLDTLHCALAAHLGPLEFLSTDTRQRALAGAAGLTLRTLGKPSPRG